MTPSPGLAPAPFNSPWPPLRSAADVESAIHTHRLACIFFTAPWCFRCQQVKPKIADFPYDFPAVRFFSVDVEAVDIDLIRGNISEISVLPTFILFHNGLEVHRLEGVPQHRPARELARALRAHLSLASSGGRG